MIVKALQFIAWGIVVLIDILGNVLLGGSVYKTISMRLSFSTRCEFVEPRYKWVMPFADFVDWLFARLGDPNHIDKNYEAHEIINPPFWRWYVIIDKQGYYKLLKEMQESKWNGMRGRKHG